ncbi:sensor histidine kinase [Culicoidibacter larvae]|uniref:histidine kinase n=1 Tax=Culicoidibacter larvae TaxID=2579976 RepID=A0A5R8QAW2_9FIRM|nr:HAMP domain-containing sensor histidine kinase [Culicoidibacter larvae]TLG73010.1 HAMP domain-containing histidine kinase [Culicoidibacter larvae]
MQKELVDIVGEVKHLILRFETAIKNKNLFFVADMPAFLEIKINRIQLKQLLYNIIANICQYTDVGGEFAITLYEEDGLLHIIASNDVSDTSAIDFARVFDLFYIAGNNELSSGVGMYVIKQAAESLGGSAQFAPTEQGVILSVQFPLIKAGDSDEA